MAPKVSVCRNFPNSAQFYAINLGKLNIVHYLISESARLQSITLSYMEIYPRQHLLPIESRVLSI